MEILNISTEINNWAILGLFMIIGGCVIGITLLETCNNIGAIITGAICVGGIALVVLSATLWRTTKYEVLIDDSIPIEHVLNNYEIKEQRGKIWVLKDKIK